MLWMLNITVDVVAVAAIFMLWVSQLNYICN